MKLRVLEKCRIFLKTQFKYFKFSVSWTSTQKIIDVVLSFLFNFNVILIMLYKISLHTTM